MASGRINQSVLQAWELGLGRPTAERAMLALEIMSSEDRPAVSDPLFARDAALIALRIALVGASLDAVVRCPACETEFDLPLDLSAFDRVPPVAEPVSVEGDGFAATVRPPVTQDLLELPSSLPPDAFAAALFQRCVATATFHGDPVGPASLPPAIRTAAATALSARDMESPFANLTCDQCGHAWQAPLDIARVLLRDIDTWARRQLDEVHRIASAYHWGESDILALSPARRRVYLEAIG